MKFSLPHVGLALSLYLVPSRSISQELSTSEIVENFQFQICFEPSFAKKSVLQISRSNNINTIELIVFEDQDMKNSDFRDKARPDDKFAFGLVDFLKGYKFRIVESTDTIVTEKVLRGRDTVTAYVISYGLDGITVSGKFTLGATGRDFGFWSPKKDSQNHKLVEHIFTISSTTFRKKRTLKYMETLEQYFE